MKTEQHCPMLTKREKEVALALLKQWHPKGKKQNLGLVARVVSQCSANIRVKLNMNSTKQAIYKAKILGLLD